MGAMEEETRDTEEEERSTQDVPLDRIQREALPGHACHQARSVRPARTGCGGGGDSQQIKGGTASVVLEERKVLDNGLVAEFLPFDDEDDAD